MNRMFCLCLFGFSCLCGADACRRAVIDVGSGSIKLMLATVEDGRIQGEPTLWRDQLGLQSHLHRTGDSRFDEEAIEACIKSLRSLLTVAVVNQYDEIQAVATAAFRQATNADEVLDRIFRDTGLRVRVIDQHVEGELGYRAAASRACSHSSKHPAVWDIGGGSVQIHMIDPVTGHPLLFKGPLGVRNLKHQLIVDVKKQDPLYVATPQPMSAAQVDQGLQIVRRSAAHLCPRFKELLRAETTQVIGIEEIHVKGIAARMNKNCGYTQDELRQYVYSLCDKTDEELGGGPFASTYLAQALLVLGIMEELGIEAVTPMATTIAEGVLISQEFWEQEAIAN